MSLIVPSVFIVVIAVAAARKVNVFSSFCAGVESGIKFALSLLPTLAAVRSNTFTTLAPSTALPLLSLPPSRFAATPLPCLFAGPARGLSVSPPPAPITLTAPPAAKMS